MTKILGVGNALVDVLTRLEDDMLLETLELPKGSMQLVDADKSAQIQEHSKNLEKSMASGGSAANTIHGLASLGVETAFVGTVGRDEVGDFFRKDMQDNKIEPLLMMSESPSGVANAMISMDGERTFGTFLGAAIELSSEKINELNFADYNILHVEGYLVQNHNLLEAILKKAKTNGLKVSIDLASYNVVEDNIDFLKDMVRKYVDILFANEEEARAFTGMEPENALNEISKDVDITIVKIGKKGSMIKQGDNIAVVGASAGISPLDTTGAGDLYAAGFLYGIVNNLDLEKSGEAGNLLAENVIQVIGAKIPNKAWEDIRNKLK